MRIFLLGFVVSCGLPQPEGECVRSLFYADADGDGHGIATATVAGCIAPPGYETTHDDCNDVDAAIHPGADERCDGLDNDCDGNVDAENTWYLDLDQDGYGDDAEIRHSCDPPYNPSSAVGGDCDDHQRDVHPGAVEVCNGVDDDCDSSTDSMRAGTT